MAFNTFVKRVRDIMRKDAGINGDAQRIEQLTWMVFLKIYDSAEALWELEDNNYSSLLKDKHLQWCQWIDAMKSGDDEVLRDIIVHNKLLEQDAAKRLDDVALYFVNECLIAGLSDLDVGMVASWRQSIIKDVFSEVHNFMKDSKSMRDIFALIDEIDFSDPAETHAFGEIYESILRELQNAGSSGEFYTPRALTDFIAGHVNLKVGDQIADLACGTGGFLNSARRVLQPQVDHGTEAQRELFSRSFHGIEKKPLPYLLCLTNLLLNGLDEPQIEHDNSLRKPLSSYGDDDCFDVILMNPPFGGEEKNDIKNNFPEGLRSSETADLFILLILKRLKKYGGRAAVIIPDGFLFGGGGVKSNIKKRLLSTANLHTVVRLPTSVFAPYTPIATNILFFDRPASSDTPRELLDSVNKTTKTWFYRVDMPKGYKNFSKTKPMKLEHLKELDAWWHDRKELKDDNGYDKACCYSFAELEASDFNLDLCGYPKAQEEEILPPSELIAAYQQERSDYNSKLDALLKQIVSVAYGNNIHCDKE